MMTLRQRVRSILLAGCCCGLFGNLITAADDPKAIEFFEEQWKECLRTLPSCDEVAVADRRLGDVNVETAITASLFNQNNYAVVYHSQCWSLTFFAGHESEIEWENVEGVRREKDRRDDTQFSLSLTLKNVGSSKVPFL